MIRDDTFDTLENKKKVTRETQNCVPQGQQYIYAFSIKEKFYFRIIQHKSAKKYTKIVVYLLFINFYKFFM